MSGTPPFRRSTRWSRESASENNRLRQTVEDQDRITTDPRGGLLTQRLAGGLQFDPAPNGILESFWIQITAGSSNPYTSWQEVRDNGDGTFSAQADGIAGNGSYPAYEVNGAVVPANAVCRAWLEDDELGVLFVYAPGGAQTVTYPSGGGTMYESGSSLTVDAGATVTLDSTTLTLTGGPLTFSGEPVIFGDYIRLGTVTHVTWGTDQTDYALPDTCVFLVVDLTADVTLKSIANGADARPLWIFNKSNAHTLTVSNENAAGTAADRMRLPGNADAALGTFDGIGLAYDATDSRWNSLDDAGGGTSDHKVLVSGTDTTAEYLGTKVAAGTGITISVLNPGADEALSVAVNSNYTQWYKWRIVVNAGTGKFDVTNPDGTTTSTALAASNTQTLNLSTMTAGTTVTAAMTAVPTGFTGVIGSITGSVGYSGGDTTHSGAASNTTAYASGVTLSVAYTRRNYISLGASSTQEACPNSATTWTLTASFSAGNNWTNATAGEFDVWVLAATAP